MTTAAAPSAADRLAELQAPGALLVSAYVRLLPEDRERRRYVLEARAAAQAALEATAAAAAPRGAAPGQDFARILEYLEDPAHLPPARGVAIFACEALSIFEVVPLPRVTRTRVRLGSRFTVLEVAAAEREFGRVVAVVLDRAHTRFFEVTAFAATELPCLPSRATRGGKYHSDRQDSPGWGEAAFHGRIREERHRHYDAIVRQLTTLDGSLGPRPLFLAGPGGAAPALRRFLPPALADRVIGTGRLNPRETSEGAVYAAVVGAREEERGRAERELAAAVERGLATRWAVNGIAATLGALGRGQVRTLLIRPNARVRGYRCGASGRLVMTADQCRWEGAAGPVADLVAEAIEEALGQGAEVRALRERDAARSVDGLAALLRFRA